MKNKIYNILLVILIIALLITLGLIAIKYGKNQLNEKELDKVVDEFKVQIDESQDENKKKVNVQYKGYNVVGIISIPKINIEYPIIDKTSDEAMKVSITKYWGNNVNDEGNLTMAGHNYFDGTSLGKQKN